MKKLFVLSFLMLAISMHAQRPEHSPRGEKGPMMEKIKEWTPEQRAELKTKSLVLHLDLNKKQEVEVQKIHLDLEKQKEQRKANRKDPKTLTADELFELKVAQLDEKIAVKRQFEAIFNKEQMEKFEKLSVQKQRRRKGQAKKKRR